MAGMNRRLLWHGLLLLLLGLLTGLVEAQLSNPRMVLAAHLEGILNGLLLLALGAIWGAVVLSPRWQGVSFWTLLYGAYANWAFTLLAAVFGTAAMSPVTAAGHRGEPWQELLVTFGFVSVGLAIIVAIGLLLWGLRGRVAR